VARDKTPELLEKDDKKEKKIMEERQKERRVQ
jgi:hypothetical protein